MTGKHPLHDLLSQYADPSTDDVDGEALLEMEKVRDHREKRREEANLVYEQWRDFRTAEFELTYGSNGKPLTDHQMM
ncbi:MAG: hypothetical protein MMC23_000128 [Stictis urceolatum]|nr:hypothetical protein [Stictis urceolata]